MSISHLHVLTLADRIFRLHTQERRTVWVALFYQSIHAICFMVPKQPSGPKLPCKNNTENKLTGDTRSA